MKLVLAPLSGTLALAAALALGSCSASQPAETATTAPAERDTALGAQTTTNSAAGAAQTKGGLTLTPFDDSPKFPTAQMQLTMPVPAPRWPARCSFPTT